MLAGFAKRLEGVTRRPRPAPGSSRRRPAPSRPSCNVGRTPLSRELILGSCTQCLFEKQVLKCRARRHAGFSVYLGRTHASLGYKSSARIPQGCADVRSEAHCRINQTTPHGSVAKQVEGDQSSSRCHVVPQEACTSYNLAATNKT